MPPRALITGVTGQDGAYLARLLLSKGYEVVGTTRSTDANNRWRLRELAIESSLRLIAPSLDTLDSLAALLSDLRPDEVYNLAGRSFVPDAVTDPLGAADANAMLPLRLLEALRRCLPQCRFFQACSSDMFGPDAPSPQNETTAFRPSGPYGYAKLFAHGMVGTYRTAHGLFCCSGVLFNHESPLRGEEFVTRKISRAVARIAQGREDCVVLGNLEARRDWGFAGEYVEGMWLSLQQPEADDYVLATGAVHSVREVVELAFAAAGIPLEWRGTGTTEEGIDPRTSTVRAKVAPELFRPSEPGLMCGDAARARERLGWVPRTCFEDLVRLMVQSDLERETNG